MNFTCNGAPYAFHAMYDTRAPPLPNGQPTAWTTWAAHTDNVAYDVETGHFEPPDAASDATTRRGHQPCFTIPPFPACLGSDSDFDGYPYHAATGPTARRSSPTPNYLSSPRRRNGRGGDRHLSDRPLRDRPAADRGGQQRRHARLRPPHRRRAAPTRHRAPSIPGTTCCASRRRAGCAWALTDDDMPSQISNFGGEQAGWGPLEQTDYGFDMRIHNFATDDHQPLPVGAPVRF